MHHPLYPSLSLVSVSRKFKMIQKDLDDNFCISFKQKIIIPIEKKNRRNKLIEIIEIIRRSVLNYILHECRYLFIGRTVFI